VFLHELQPIPSAHVHTPDTFVVTLHLKAGWHHVHGYLAAHHHGESLPFSDTPLHPEVREQEVHHSFDLYRTFSYQESSRDELHAAFQLRLTALMDQKQTHLPLTARAVMLDTACLVLWLKTHSHLTRHTLGQALTLPLLKLWHEREAALAWRRLQACPQVLQALVGATPFVHAQHPEVVARLPFEKALSLVSARQVILEQGFALVTAEQLSFYLGRELSRTGTGLGLLAARFHVADMTWYPDFDQVGLRAYRALKDRLEREVALKYGSAGGDLKALTYRAGDPPCWRRLVAGPVQHKLKFDQRVAVGQLYRALGITWQAAEDQWQEVYRSKPSELKNISSYWKSQQKYARDAKSRCGPSCIAFVKRGLCPQVEIEELINPAQPQDPVLACRTQLKLEHLEHMRPAEVLRHQRRTATK
jgi:hypothetical protein